MQIITLIPTSAQIVNVSLDGQDCALRVVQRSTGLFMDISLSGNWIARSVACLNCNRLVRYEHLGFKGDLFFADMIGSADPVYDELGSRFVLFYATEQEIAAA